jgi:hypothetical protein
MAAYETGRAPGYRGHTDSTADGLARGLGWFSIALGAAEVLAPRQLASTLGMEGYERLITAYGVREIVQGVGILASEDPTPWIWGRVAGDALDIATVTAGLSRDNPRRENAVVALVALLGATAVDLYCANRLSEERTRSAGMVRDYRDRSGWPRPVEAMRGAAREDGFEIPDDMRGPPALRPYGDGSEATSTVAAASVH